MPRYKLTIEYHGAPFLGWQIQAEGLTVQGALADAVFALTGEKAAVNGAGRTDAGVHARGQVAHIDLSKDWRTDVLRDGLTAKLRPHPVAVLAADDVPGDFDARFSAVKRHYLYRIITRRPDLTLEAGLAWRWPRWLDENAMHAAAQELTGKHDFTTFRSTECQAKSPVKTLDRLDVRREGDNVLIEASARSFLHNQVRSMVGSLLWAGDGRWTAADIRAALEARDRTACGPVAPPDGLYLMRVDY
ncbi:MAG TPA: tRNA pseudouridine(38-40) synthase TruA [Pseudolabrys sp.]